MADPSRGPTKSRSTLIGLVVLAILVVGGYWARRVDAPDRNYFPKTGACSGGSPREAGEPPDITGGECSVDAGDVRVFVSVTPRPPVAMAVFTIRVTVAAPASGLRESQAWSSAPPMTLDGGRVRFEMSMPMGEHRYSLVRHEPGWYEAEVVLPACPSGARRWYATVEGTVGGRPISARVRFDVGPSAS